MKVEETDKVCIDTFRKGVIYLHVCVCVCVCIEWTFSSRQSGWYVQVVKAMDY